MNFQEIVPLKSLMDYNFFSTGICNFNLPTMPLPLNHPNNKLPSKKKQKLGKKRHYWSLTKHWRNFFAVAKRRGRARVELPGWMNCFKSISNPDSRSNCFFELQTQNFNFITYIWRYKSRYIKSKNQLT